MIRSKMIKSKKYVEEMDGLITSNKNLTTGTCRLTIAATNGVQSTLACNAGLTERKRTLSMQFMSTPFCKSENHLTQIAPRRKFIVPKLPTHTLTKAVTTSTNPLQLADTRACLATSGPIISEHISNSAASA